MPLPILGSNGGWAIDNTNPPATNATLPPIGAGNTVLIFTVGSATAVGPPDGFSNDFQFGIGGFYGNFFRQTGADGQTSWPLAMSIVGFLGWIAVEMPDAAPVYNAGNSNIASNQTVSDWSTGTTPTWPVQDATFFALHGMYEVPGTSGSWSGQTNGYTEQYEVASSWGAPTVTSVLALSTLDVADGSAQSCTATRSPTTSTALGGYIAGYQPAIFLDPRGMGAVQVG